MKEETGTESVNNLIEASIPFGTDVFFDFVVVTTNDMQVNQNNPKNINEEREKPGCGAYG